MRFLLGNELNDHFLNAQNKVEKTKGSSSLTYKKCKKNWNTSKLMILHDKYRRKRIMRLKN